MKTLILIFSIAACSFSSLTQIDIGTDASFSGVWVGGKVSYPIEDRLIIGGSYSYNIVNPYIDHRVDGVIGFKFDEWLQIESDIGVMISSKNKMFRHKLGRNTLFHVDFGAKFQTKFNMYFTLQIAWPGFIKFGLGLRLRPFKKLTVWDFQD